MATVKPFQPYRYTSKAGDPAHLLTQPYDKINPAMQAKYLAASPYNLVRVILGERHAQDNASDNVYTRAAKYLGRMDSRRHPGAGPEPGFYAYFQEFTVPDTGERATRKGFIGLGKWRIMRRAWCTATSRRFRVPRRIAWSCCGTRARTSGRSSCCIRIAQGRSISVLTSAAAGAPDWTCLDEYSARHRLWGITDPRIAADAGADGDKKLLIADGHHRYETALAYRNENPESCASTS